MKIIICGSMTTAKAMLSAKEKLVAMGHSVTMPEFTEDYAQMESLDHVVSESAKNKIEHDLIKRYYNKIKDGDAILVINEDKNGKVNYIGGNSFLEMGFAYVLNKKIFLLNPIPELSYTDEIIAMQPIIINGDLKKIE
jgi:predicted RNA-binding protein with PUA domain